MLEVISWTKWKHGNFLRKPAVSTIILIIRIYYIWMMRRIILMVLTTKGVILKQRPIGEQDKIITILSDELGMIEASARRIKSSKSKFSSSLQPLTYCEFTLYHGRDHYIVNAAYVIESFYNIRLDVVKVSLAAYFCDLMCFVHPTCEDVAPYKKLLLNSLYFLAEGKKSLHLLKPVYELRLLSISGFMPDLVACRKCACYEKEEMYFYPVNGYLLCDDCKKSSAVDAVEVRLTGSVLAAMRHIIYSVPEKIFSFQLSEKSLKSLSEISEYYTLCQIDRSFSSLEMYHSILSEVL